MHVEVLGSGGAIPIVLIHGWAMHGGILSPLAESLVRRLRVEVHLVDLPGHGRSREDGESLDLDSCFDRLVGRVPSGAIWIGWSLGGLVALHAALTASSDVAGLGMICASPCFVRRDGWPHGVPWAVFERFGSELAADYRGTIERFLALEAQGDARAQSCLRALRSQVFEHGAPSAAALTQGLRVLEQSDFSQRLSRLTCPSLWLSGARDRLVSWQAMAYAAERARGRHHRIEGAAHAPFLTHPSEVLAQLELLVREVHRE